MRHWGFEVLLDHLREWLSKDYSAGTLCPRRSHVKRWTWGLDNETWKWYSRDCFCYLSKYATAMPTTSAAAKALRQNVKARARNTAVKNGLKKFAVQLRKAYTAKDLNAAKKITADYIRALDKAAQKRIIHRNTAARKKSRLAARLTRGV